MEATPALCEAVDRACQADTAKRFASAEAFILALRAALGTATPASIQAGAAISPGATQAYLADAGRVASRVADTELVPGGFTGTVRLPQNAVRELTERVEALEPVNRDAQTQARCGPRPRGPGGTELLPAVAARREPAPMSAPPSSALKPSVKVAAPTHSGRKAGLFGIPVTSWLAGGAAFVVPVLIAGLLAFWQFGTPVVQGAAAQSTPAQTASTAAPIDPTTSAAAVDVASDGAQDAGTQSDGSVPPEDRAISNRRCSQANEAPACHYARQDCETAAPHGSDQHTHP